MKTAQAKPKKMRFIQYMSNQVRKLFYKLIHSLSNISEQNKPRLPEFLQQAHNPHKTAALEGV